MARRRNMFRPRRPLGSFLLTTTTFIAFAAIIWHAYQDNISQNRAEASIPLIRASSEPFKVKPSDERGMQIAHRDILVFDQIEEPFAGREREITKVRFVEDEIDETILPPLTGLTKIDDNFDINQAHQGESRKQVAALLSYEQNNGLGSSQKESVGAVPPTSPFANAIQEATEEEKLDATLELSVKEEITSLEATPTEDFVEDIHQNLGVTAEVKKMEVEPEPQPQKVLIMKGQASESTIRPVVAGDYIIQLGAVRSEAGAKEEWQKLSNRLPGVLSNLSLNVERADLGDRGVFYRIQGGSVSKSEADDICAKIKRSGADCLVRKIQ